MNDTGTVSVMVFSETVPPEAVAIYPSPVADTEALPVQPVVVKVASLLVAALSTEFLPVTAKWNLVHEGNPVSVVTWLVTRGKTFTSWVEVEYEDVSPNHTREDAAAAVVHVMVAPEELGVAVTRVGVGPEFVITNEMLVDVA